MAIDDPDVLVSRVREALAPTYRLDRSLGAGGMARVYLAHDLKHERTVAIKVLRSELVATIGAERFLREIRVVARLTHPNILPLIDSGDLGGMPYYVMPFVEGESLRARLDRTTTLPLDDAITLTAEVADALDYAHAARIIHRDIKPENILMLGGHAVIADFGIARAIGIPVGNESLTTAGIVLGTPAYMSPEQAAGNDDIDGRSDVYALATVFFEMIAGAVPFHAKSAQQLIAARFMQAAPRLSSVLSDIPPHVDAAVASALSIEADDRPGTAGEFVQRLLGASPRNTLQTAAYTTLGDPSMPSVAVLPFTNLSADPENEFLSDGLTEDVMGALARLRTLRVAAKASSFAFKGRREDVRVIARQLNVGAILDGSVRKAGARVRVSAQLVDAQSGFEVWSDQFDRDTNDIFEIQSEIAQAIAGALRATLLDSGTTSQQRAVPGLVYETYLRGRYALNKRTERDLDQATIFFETAERDDREFALAPAGLADALVMLGVYGTRRAADVMPRARSAADRALAIDPSLPEAHATLGVIRGLFDWDWRGSKDAFRRAMALGPRYSTALQWFAVNHLIPRARFAEARATIDRARALDPLSIVIATSVGVVQHLSGDAPGAVVALKRVRELDATFAMANYFLGSALRDTGDLPASADAFRSAIAQTGGTPEMFAGLAQTLARQGDKDGARALRDQLTCMARERCVAWCLFAQIDAELGNIDEALSSLEKAVPEREPELAYIGVRSAYAPLVASDRFASIRKQVGV